MHVDDNGIALITSHEGLRLKAYYDKHGKLWTIGYGHTATAKQGMKITKDQAVALLRRDLERFEQCVEENVRVPITQGMFNALVSFAYNMGCGGFKRSDVLEMVNSGQMDDAMAAFNQYTKAGGKVLGGLVKRRRAESVMFASGSVQRQNQSLAALRWVFGGNIMAVFGRS